MSTLHLVEIDDEENIVDEVLLTDEILESLNEETGETELSLSDDNNRLCVVELDDDGNIVGAEMLGADEEEDATELSLSDRVEALELGLMSMMGKGVASMGRGVAKMKTAVGNSFKHGGAGDKMVRRTVGHRGRTAGIKAGRMVARNPIKSAAAGGAAAGYVGGQIDGRHMQRKKMGLSLSAAQLQSVEHNPMLADAQKRLPAAK